MSVRKRGRRRGSTGRFEQHRLRLLLGEKTDFVGDVNLASRLLVSVKREEGEGQLDAFIVRESSSHSLLEHGMIALLNRIRSLMSSKNLGFDLEVRRKMMKFSLNIFEKQKEIKTTHLLGDQVSNSVSRHSDISSTLSLVRYEDVDGTEKEKEVEGQQSRRNKRESRKFELTDPT